MSPREARAAVERVRQLLEHFERGEMPRASETYNLFTPQVMTIDDLRTAIYGSEVAR